MCLYVYSQDQPGKDASATRNSIHTYSYTRMYTTYHCFILLLCLVNMTSGQLTGFSWHRLWLMLTPKVEFVLPSC